MPARPTPNRRLLGLAAVTLLLAGLGLTACGSSGDDVELVEGVTENVDALDNSFAPEEITVQAGTEIVFTNRGRNDHNVIPADPDEDWEIPVEDFKPGSEGRPVRFTEPGTYDYYCSIHGTATAGMTGSITVEG
jgi:plastocyanin